MISRADRPVGFSEIAAELNLSRQAVHRIAVQMEGLSLIRRVPGRDGLIIGPGGVEIALGLIHAASHAAPVSLILRDLVGAIGETCNVGVIDRDQVVYIERVECDWPLRLTYHAGSRVPIHASGIGKLLMAHLPARTRRRILSSAPLPKLTDHTVTDPVALETQFKQIRKQGFAANNQENVVGLMGFAVPIRNAKGDVIAGVSVHAPVARMTPAQAQTHLPLFKQAAARLSACFADMTTSEEPAADD